MSKRGRDWAILQTAPSRTLPLARALSGAGFDVWTPIETEVKRVGPARDRVERALPMTPTFVFARADRLADLVTLAKAPSLTWLAWDTEAQRMLSHGVPYFTIFRDAGGYGFVSDSALEPLRRIERAVKPKSQVRVFQPGDEVTYPDAGFEGLTGIVQGMKGRFAVVMFLGWPIGVQIDPRYLLPRLPDRKLGGQYKD